MTRTSLWIHVGLCAAALVWAIRAAHTERERVGPSSVMLLPADEGEVARVDYTWEKGHTEVTRTAGGFVVRVDRELSASASKADDTRKDAEKAPKPTADQAMGQPAPGENEAAPGTADDDASRDGAAPVPPAREQRSFPGGRPVSLCVKGLEPLRTKRTLGVVDDARLLAMGLAAPSRTLTVTTQRGRTITLEVGESSYGAQGRYARVKGDAVVHLIDAAVVAGVEGGVETLGEKQPLTAEWEDVRGYAVVANGRSASFVHVARTQPTKRFFARRDDDKVKDDAGTKLFATLRNLRGAKILDALDDGIAAAAAENVIVAFEVDASPLRTLTIIEQPGGAGHQIRSASFAWELPATQVKELLDDVDAAFAP
jgi:hypothetical protein